MPTTCNNAMHATVVVEKLLPGGAGLARLAEGGMVLVDGAASGDTLEILVRRGRANTRVGTIERIVTPSPDRLDPPPAPCPACDWAHLTRAAQLREKRLLVADCLRRIGGMSEPEIAERLADTLAPAAEQSQRNKITLAIDESQPEAVRIGYRQPGSRNVLAMAACPQVPGVFAEVITFLGAHWPGNTGADSLTLRQNTAGDILLSLRGERLRPAGVASRMAPIIAPLCEAFPAITGIDVLGGGGHRVLMGQAFLCEDLGPWTFQVGSESFFQVNHAAARLLLGAVQECLRAICLPTGGQPARRLTTALDLYAGVGTFTFALAEWAGQVIAMESDDGAIADLAGNCQRNGATTVDVRHGDVAALLAALDEPVDLALVDPPRAGCQSEVTAWLAAHVREAILMVSCDPATLARDIKRLTADGDWRIERLQPIDMFADTHHVETLAFLRRVLPA